MKKSQVRFTYFGEDDFPDEDDWMDTEVVTTYKKRNKRNKYSIK